MGAADFVESYFEAWNHCDPEAVADHLAPDGIYCDIPLNLERSHDELIVSLAEFFANYSHRYELIGEALFGHDTIAFQYHIFTTGKSESAKSRASYFGAEFMTLNGAEAITIIDYYAVPGTERSAKFSQIAPASSQTRKYAKSGLNDKQLHDYKLRLEHIMRTQQAYLTPDLTLPKLAKAVKCSVNHLSQVINAGFGMSFFDYLNQYRISHAKQLLARLDGQSNAILNIAFTVGFNSNSAFYAAFKKCVGQTPAQYRRAKLKNRH